MRSFTLGVEVYTTADRGRTVELEGGLPRRELASGCPGGGLAGLAEARGEHGMECALLAQERRSGLVLPPLTKPNSFRNAR